MRAAAEAYNCLLPLNCLHSITRASVPALFMMSVCTFLKQQRMLPGAYSLTRAPVFRIVVISPRLHTSTTSKADSSSFLALTCSGRGIPPMPASARGAS